MIGKEKIKFVRSLHQKKFRQKYNKFIAEGPKIVSECIIYCPDQIETIYGLPSYIQTLDIQDRTLNEKLIAVDENQLKKISALENPHQILAVLRKAEIHQEDLRGDALYLDNVQIPNNVGAILRIADWYGIRNIILSPLTADVYSPKVIQASMGSFMRLKFHWIDQKIIRDYVPNHSIVVADGGGMSMKSFAFSEPMILVLGNEGHGPSVEIQKGANYTISIDRVGDGQLPESLNVAVATGILCSKWKG